MSCFPHMPNCTTTAELWSYGLWGPVTATLDWCELNYQFSHYIAEMANTFSNLVTIGLAVRGGHGALRESLPTRYIAGYAGFGLVGLGSFAFHATLLFQAQLADELPMVYVGSMGLWLLFDDEPGFSLRSRRTWSLVTALIAFDILFTWSYYVYRNPVYHQLVFASIVLSVAFRVTYLLKRSDVRGHIPNDTKSAIGKLFTVGAALFTLGFIIWNLDNIYCTTLTRWKAAIGWPLAFLLEGHSWWHILTGTGAYLKYTGIQYVTLCVKDNHRNYGLEYSFGLPYIKRTGKKLE